MMNVKKIRILFIVMVITMISIAACACNRNGKKKKQAATTTTESKSVYGDADEEYEGKFDNKMRDSYGYVFKTDIQN